MHAASWGNGDVTHVLVHGLGGSHLDWMLVGGRLAERGRLLAPDLPGWGHMPPLEAPERFTRAVDAFTASARERLAELSSARP